ncbi:MAG: MbnP family protein [Bergeyella cardium]
MTDFKKILLGAFVATTLVACSGSNNDDSPAPPQQSSNNVTLKFNNVMGSTPLALGTEYTSNNQKIKFTEVKYVISDIYLVKSDGTKVPYNVDNLDKGATVVNLAKSETLSYVLEGIELGEYNKIILGFGVKSSLNTLDQQKFPNFYAAAGANDTKMHWEWGNGYRFTKLEGTYGDKNEALSIHTGSTVKGTRDNPSTYVPGVDAFRDVTLELSSKMNVTPKSSPTITINADWDKLLNGKTKITLSGKIPTIHHTQSMIPVVNNLAGEGRNLDGSYVDANYMGMFSVSKVEH